VVQGKGIEDRKAHTSSTAFSVCLGLSVLGLIKRKVALLIIQTKIPAENAKTSHVPNKYKESN
jgi:hypothetical protein